MLTSTEIEFIREEVKLMPFLVSIYPLALYCVIMSVSRYTSSITLAHSVVTQYSCTIAGAVENFVVVFPIYRQTCTITTMTANSLGR